MSNKIDFFQSQQNQLSIPAASVSILIDGTLCTDLEPVEIVRSGRPEFGWAKLTYNPAANTNADIKPLEEIVNEFSAGKSISIRQHYNPDLCGSAIFGLPIFNGQIDSIETQLSSDGEKVEITARDFSMSLKRISVYGQRVAIQDGSSKFLDGLGTIFNPDCKGNANQTAINLDGKSYTVFRGQSTQSRLWTYAEVIDYLLSEYVPAGQLKTPIFSRLQALTENQIVRDIDVTGLNLIEALYRCCKRIGLKFKFVPRLVNTGPNQAIVFYRAGTGRVVELNCQPSGQQISISKTNIAKLHSRKNFWPITHKYLGQGDFKIYEATFDLIKAWDADLEQDNYESFSPSTNANFCQVKDVYRKWCLNETGQYSSSPYSQGDAFDFSQIFQSSSFIYRHRRFRPSLTTDAQGRSLGYYLQVSYNNGQNFWQYLHAFNILLDECGVWLSSDQLDMNTWIAAVQNTLKFRITASVVSDERLTAVAINGPFNSTAPIVEHIITLPRQFKYRKVSDQSIFTESSSQAFGTPDVVDDSTALYEFVRHTATTSSEAIETIDIQTPSLMFDYRLGDIVSTSPDSRDLLSSRSDNRSTSRIERVQMDFKKQCTNLKIVRQRNQYT
jgi:hypothetical protein